MKILTIEDQPVAAMLLGATLRSLGHTVDQVGDATEALARITAGDYRVVVSDWRMPGMDGLALCRAIRDRGGDYVYFILISAQRITRENRRLALAAGVDDFLMKPIDADEIDMRLHVAGRIIGLSEKLVRLSGFVPVCRACHRSRDDAEFWQEVEALVHRCRTEESVLDVCPQCAQREQSGPSLA